MGQPNTPKKVLVYEDEQGNEPFSEWFKGLKDLKGKERIGTRIRRLSEGLYGDSEPVGEGVSELRLFFGPGYRVYFGEEANNIVILLCGGDKSSQKRDIQTAKGYWKEYKKHG
ncbi:type II toxin-antitoxin system RelE/ParE family toxin [uncultured Nitrospira sp.]|uniref:type II toxin-antitoxin system RelE/ParE family toxin n=1 Tax=uncultured Nitrospira sp. TaxID=157176 RepID=UPI003140BE90